MLICEVLLHLLMESNYFNAVIRVDLNHRKLLSTKLRSGFVNFEVAVHTTVFLGGMFFSRSHQRVLKVLRCMLFRLIINNHFNFEEFFIRNSDFSLGRASLQLSEKNICSVKPLVFLSRCQVSSPSHTVGGQLEIVCEDGFH